MRAVCTIATRGELPEARAMAWSLRRRDSLARLFVLVLDDRGHDIDPAQEPFTVVRPGSLDISGFELLAGMYTKRELQLLVEPSLLRRVLDMTGSAVLHLAIDVLVYAALEAPFTLAREHRLLLVPRLLAPVPRDDLRITDDEIIELGVFDEGCLAMAPGEEVDAFLRAWSDRMEFNYGSALQARVSRFLDLAPALIESAKILVDPGLAPSRLNMHERTISRRSGRFCVNGQPLTAVHFEGLNGNEKPTSDPFDGPADDGLLSGANRVASLQAARRSALQRALRERNADFDALVTEREQLLEWCGGKDSIKSSYGYGRLADGTPLNRRLRGLVRDAACVGAVEGSPFSAIGTHDLLDWMNGPAERGARTGVTRYWFRVYCERPDLQAAFPDLDGSDASGFMRWARDWGVTEYATPRSLLPFVIS